MEYMILLFCAVSLYYIIVANILNNIKNIKDINNKILRQQIAIDKNEELIKKYIDKKGENNG